MELIRCTLRLPRDLEKQHVDLRQELSRWWLGSGCRLRSTVGEVMKRTVISYAVQVVGTGVEVDIETDRKKPHKYRIFADVRHPNINEIARHLDAGLGEAQRLGAKIDISEYFERMYVFIVTPIEYHSDQYSARER